MGRIDNIEKFAQKRDYEQMEKEIAVQNQIEECKERIKVLKPRIDELLAVGNACMKNGIPLVGQAFGCREGYDTHQFMTNGWSHLLGFVRNFDQKQYKDLPFTKLGIQGGGACWYDLKTDGVTVDVSGKESLHVLKRFVNEFDEFETEFYKYVDKVTA